MKSFTHSSISRLCAALMFSVGLGVAAPVVSHAQVSVQFRFDDHDRQSANDWYRQHQTAPPIGLRDRDRLSPEFERRFEAGWVIDRSLRGGIHAAPREVTMHLRPAPRGDRYVFIGGHLALIDARYQVVDVIHLGHDR